MNFFKDKFFFLTLLFLLVFFMQGVFNLPVLDRDEARFATASKTMLETKDFLKAAGNLIDEYQNSHNKSS